MQIHYSVIGKILANGSYRLILEESYRKGLLQLQGFSHITVLWHADRFGNAGSTALVIPKPYAHGPDQIGVFATRSPFRPNSICVSIAEVLRIDEERGVVEIAWIDAADGSPILDIKPYHGCEERIRQLQVPQWCAHWPQWIEDSETFDWENEIML
jgi:tRNA-Thr(GGU) m(6)t(6)A37 methyltransferase TsaA